MPYKRNLKEPECLSPVFAHLTPRSRLLLPGNAPRILDKRLGVPRMDTDA